MADYGHELRFGVMPQPGADWRRDVVRLYNIDWAPGRSGSGFLHGPPRAVAEQLADITFPRA